MCHNDLSNCSSYIQACTFITLTSHECHVLSNYRHLGCMSNRLFMLTTKKTSSSLFLTICEGKPQAAVGFPPQRASNEQKMVITWRLDISGELGGFMGLFLGASVLTLCELFDFLIYNCVRKLHNRRKVSSDVSAAWGTCIPRKKWYEH